MIKNGFRKIFFLSDVEHFTRFDVLDGFRGLLAISVIIQHTIMMLPLKGDYLLYDRIGTFIGVSTFFVLSSFLLTYKL